MLIISVSNYKVLISQNSSIPQFIAPAGNFLLFSCHRLMTQVFFLNLNETEQKLPTVSDTHFRTIRDSLF